MRHYCHANRLSGCMVEIEPELFMCRRHWYMLPKWMRDAIWCAYQPGRERRRVRPNKEYLQITDRAERYIAEQTIQ